MARPVPLETKIVLATPIFRRLLQWVLVLLQHMKYDLRSCGLVRGMVGRDEQGFRMDDRR